MIRFSPSSRKAWRGSAAGFFFLLVGASLVAAGTERIPAEPASHSADRRVLDTEQDTQQDTQDDQDDLALTSRGAGRLAEIQQDSVSSALAGRILGPPAPAAGEAVSRDAEGGVTLRAFRLAEPLTVDGVLDDPVYDQIPAAEGFLQQEPDEGAPVSESTRVWVLYDADSLYVAAELEEDHPSG